MKCYLINLDRSPERLAFFERQALAAAIDFERIPAIDGRDLDPSTLSEAVSDRFTFQPINTGEAALFLSHRNCWNQFLSSQCPYAAIFEDDAVLARQTGRVLDQIETLRPQVDIIKLETTLRKVVLEIHSVEIEPGFRLQKLLTWHGGTAAYVVSRAGAQKLLHLTLPFADPVDQAIFNPLSSLSASLAIAQLVPAVSIQHMFWQPDSADSAFRSTIGRQKKRRGLVRHGPLIDIRRAWLKYRERWRRHALARLPDHQQTVVDFVETSAE